MYPIFYPILQPIHNQFSSNKSVINYNELLQNGVNIIFPAPVLRYECIIYEILLHRYKNLAEYTTKLNGTKSVKENCNSFKGTVQIPFQ